MTEQEAEFLKRLRQRAHRGYVLYGVATEIGRELGLPRWRVESLRMHTGLKVIPGEKCIKGPAEHEFVRLMREALVDGKLPNGDKRRLAEEAGIPVWRAGQLMRLLRVQTGPTRQPDKPSPADELRMIEAAFAAVRS